MGMLGYIAIRWKMFEFSDASLGFEPAAGCFDDEAVGKGETRELVKLWVWERIMLYFERISGQAGIRP